MEDLEDPLFKTVVTSYPFILDIGSKYVKCGFASSKLPEITFKTPLYIQRVCLTKRFQCSPNPLSY